MLSDEIIEKLWFSINRKKFILIKIYMVNIGWTTKEKVDVTLSNFYREQFQS